MVKKTIKYVDYNDVEREETFYFNLSKTELSRMAMSADGDLSEKIKEIVKAKDNKSILKIFEDIILQSYGVKSDDGKHFVKKAVDGHLLADDFVNSPAYDELYFELIQDSKKMGDFINMLIPRDLAEEAKKLQAEEEKKLLES